MTDRPIAGKTDVPSKQPRTLRNDIVFIFALAIGIYLIWLVRHVLVLLSTAQIKTAQPKTAQVKGCPAGPGGPRTRQA